jgi:hypothetical protein
MVAPLLSAVMRRGDNPGIVIGSTLGLQPTKLPATMLAPLWRGGRAVEDNGLKTRRCLTGIRGFESLPLRRR